MPFTVEDLQDLLRLLEQHPEWKGVLRASLLGEELLRVPEILRELAEEVRKLAEAQRRTEEAQRRTEETIRTLVRRVGDLEGDNLERLYRERAASYFQDILRRIRLVDHQRLGLLLDDALDAGRISREERAEVLRKDVVLEGMVDGQEVYLLAEVSVTVQDVRRALGRAALLEKALGRPVLAAVAGRELSTDRETLEEAERVWRVVDGKTESPSV